MSQDLKPCPFCGSDVDIACVEMMSSRDAGPVYVHCDGCGADGPQHDWADDATRDWNRRAVLHHPAAQAPAAEPLREFDVSVLIAENPRDRDLVRAVERAHGIGTAATKEQ